MLQLNNPGRGVSKARNNTARADNNKTAAIVHQGNDFVISGRLSKPYGLPQLIAGLCILALISINTAIAQEQADVDQGTEAGKSDGPGSGADSGDEIDEITVVGPRSLVLIKRQIERADFELYGIANALIDDPMYKTYCRRTSVSGSRLKRRICLPGYERELMSEAWEDERTMGRMGEGGYTFNYKLPESELREYRENRKQMMIELAAENPELAAAIYKRGQLQRDYEAERRRRQQQDE